ncbi:MAG TPA: PLP-dependent aminotransferase family protein [Solirubrobacteraceae bacterium]|jgi:2-aminoadipate transaminase|nr:PLP-dependent aminotransferase family protein [Solirubrobacteraceae bacterium]
MDREIASTLGELERKLHELERTLVDIGSRASGSNDGAPPERPPEPSRLVDEAIEPAPAPAPAPPAPRAQALQGAASGYGHPPTAAELLRFRERLERTARELTHDYDELLGRLRAVEPAPAGPAISFARGAPSLDIVDVEGLREAAVRAFESDAAGATAYGTSVGYPRLRAWIADRHGVEVERVLVTNGSLQADAFLFELLVNPGDDVVVERPTYDRTLLSLRNRGARVHAIELLRDGINTEDLARLLGDRRGARPKLAHIIPNFQNPAGHTLSLHRREALLALAAQYDFAVFEDDPYVALRFTGESLPTMLSMDPERVVYASSFSKTVCPGVRVGYLVGPPELIGRVAQLATNTYISPSMVAQAIVYEFCASGAIERSIATVRSALAERALALEQALRLELPEAEFVPPEGGYFLWVTLPPGTDVAALQRAAEELGVSFVKGSDFMLEGGENALRLAYSGVTPRQIEEGVSRLAAAYRSLAR